MKFKRLQAMREYMLVSFTANHSDGTCVCAVIGFSTNSFSLNTRQRTLLGMSIPAVQRPESILEMYARTDRSGSDEYNMGLSRRRLGAVQTALVSLGAPREKVLGDLCKPLGENFERFFGVPDEARHAGGRAVWSFLWPSQAAFDEGPEEDTENSFRELVTFGRNFTPG